jgi:hypothetical protein
MSVGRDIMRKPSVFLPIVLGLGIIILTPVTDVRADGSEEGPFEIEKCQTISQPGSYKLVGNVRFSGTTGACLNITSNNVTIDLAGFTISGPPGDSNSSTAILTTPPSGGMLQGIAVRNGSISGFSAGVVLQESDGDIVEELRVSATGQLNHGSGIVAAGIVKGNTVTGFIFAPLSAPGVSATGIVTGNYLTDNRFGIVVGAGSTVIGNTVLGSFDGGLTVQCPSNATNNTIVDGPIFVSGTGCNLTNNVGNPVINLD